MFLNKQFLANGMYGWLHKKTEIGNQDNEKHGQIYVNQFFFINSSYNNKCEIIL